MHLVELDSQIRRDLKLHRSWKLPSEGGDFDCRHILKDHTAEEMSSIKKIDEVLRAVISMHSLFLVKPDPVPEDCTDPRWKWFKGCLGALDGWEGSAGDARVLRDAINRPQGLKVPVGNYYLCDNGYANSDGFLTPYKGNGINKGMSLHKQCGNMTTKGASSFSHREIA
ncbi:hypothetical protein AAHA92_24867 [Salvia divinorum]|uniref:DDE Tnp4 domain-containing protein n=1 Tax=Salvia divinorum TaxID=28513 RepID=A0ABD1G8W9_SALDI